MIQIDWLASLLGTSVPAILALNGALWVTQANQGARGTRARYIAAILYWPVCVLALTPGLVFLGSQPRLAESFTSRPELWIFPTIAAAGLLGIAFLPGGWLESRRSFVLSGVYRRSDVQRYGWEALRQRATG